MWRGIILQEREESKRKEKIKEELMEEYKQVKPLFFFKIYSFSKEKSR